MHWNQRLPALGLLTIVAIVGCTRAGAEPSTAPPPESASASTPAPSHIVQTTPQASAAPSDKDGVAVIEVSGSLRDAAWRLIGERRPTSCVKEITANVDPAAVEAALKSAPDSGSFAEGRGWIGSMTDAVKAFGGTEVLVRKPDGPVWLVASSDEVAAIAAVPSESLVLLELRPYELPSGGIAWFVTGNAEASDEC